MINFDASFDVNSLYGTTTVKCAEEILSNTIDAVVPQAELVHMTSIYSNAGSNESVRGTLLGGDLTPPKHKLRGRDTFKRNWLVCTKTPNGKRKYFVLRGSKELKTYTIVKPTYDTPNKQAARKKGCLWALRQIDTPSPELMTLGGPEAVCARRFNEIKPDANIINVDINEAVLEASSKLDIPMKNVLGDIGKIFRKMVGKNTGLLIYDTDDFKDLINYDTDGYFCETLVSNLEVVNNNILCDWFVVTIQGNDSIRNSGQFAKEFKEKATGGKNAIPNAIEDIMTNYKLLRHFKYKRTDDSRVEMRTMVFKLK